MKDMKGERGMSRATTAALAAFVLLSLPEFALAAENCAELDTTQAGLNECYARRAQASDRRLNRLNRALQDRLVDEPDKARLLQAAQRAWMGFRDAECAFVTSGVTGGSARPMVENQCLADLTDERNEDLQAYAGCQEGDLACPVPPAP